MPAAAAVPQATASEGPCAGVAVVVGCGSAGRRHIAALRAERPDLSLVVVRRAGRLDLPAAVATAPVEVTSDLATALRHGVHLGVVAGPAPAHPTTALGLLDAGAAAVLVEKPLDTDDADPARWLRPGPIERVVVGYHLRFGAVLPLVRRAVAEGRIGTPTGFALAVGQHLSMWRPGTDPAQSVSARAELGGGVLLELSHELDALRVMLGDEVARVTSATLRHDGAPTDGLVETVADLELTLAGGPAGTVHLDMTSDPPVRTWRITGTGGTLHADLLESSVHLEHPDGTCEQLLAATPGERDRAETALIQHLLAVASGESAPACTVIDGLRVLEIVAAARRSAVEGRPVPVPHPGSTDGDA